MTEAPRMEKIAFRMMLKPGMADEYRRRHDAIWPELVTLLRVAGVRDYSIHLDAGTHHLFAVLWRPADHGMGALRDQPVMRRWWDTMAGIMEVEADNRPVAVALDTLFHLA
jgi:L-rhamnose mutarotase